MESELLIDRETALPIVIRTRIWGAPNAPPLVGPVDYVVRTYVALPGMQDPMTQLVAAPVPTATAEQEPQLPPRPEKPAAPKKPVVAKPAPAKDAPPKPTASPTKPATPAPAAPATTPGDDVGARLEILGRL
jgi:hypothetical protein